MFFPNNTGMIKIGGYLAGGHAYVINGVNTINKTFRIKNSWGKSWGDKGHAYISFNDMKRFTETKDKGRNESFVETFPYYKEWYNSLEIKSFEETFSNHKPFENPQIIEEPIQNNETWRKLMDICEHMYIFIFVPSVK